MLTRKQIDEFVDVVPDIGERRFDCLPRWMKAAGLVEEAPSSRHACGLSRLTMAGEDLLSTIPHLPPVEAVPAIVGPSCSRCGGEGHVPLFMGHASGGGTMPCPACSVDAGPALVPVTSGLDAMRQRLADARDVWRRVIDTTHLKPSLPASRNTDAKATLPSDSLNVILGGPASDTVSPSRGNGWLHIDSEETARSFVGHPVEIHAPAGSRENGRGFPAHADHTKSLYMNDAGSQTFGGMGWSVCWKSRGNVYLRRVNP
jgi:hypothetical protein